MTPTPQPKTKKKDHWMDDEHLNLIHQLTATAKMRVAN